MHTSRTFFSRQPDIILKLFFYLFHFASTTEGSLLGSPLFHTGIVHAHLSPRLVAGLQLSSNSLHVHCRKGSASFTWFLARRQSVVCLSRVTVYTLIKRAHFSPTLYAGLSHSSLATSEKRTKIHSMGGQSYSFQFLCAFLQLLFIIISILYDLSSATKTSSSTREYQ